MPDSCIICKRKTSIKESVSLHRFPAALTKRNQWLAALSLEEHAVKDHHRVCSLHFRNGDTSQVPSLVLGKRFLSPIKRTIRAERATKRATYQPPPSSTTARDHHATAAASATSLLLVLNLPLTHAVTMLLLLR